MEAGLLEEEVFRPHPFLRLVREKKAREKDDPIFRWEPWPTPSVEPLTLKAIDEMIDHLEKDQALADQREREFWTRHSLLYNQLAAKYQAGKDPRLPSDHNQPRRNKHE